MVEMTGLGAVFPRLHSEVSLTVLAMESRSSMSSSRPLPSVIRVSISSICRVPSRHGVHLPHDSAWVKLRKNRAISTMQVVSSMTTIPPEPTIEPSLASDS
ncbi:hypothetical protein ES703_65989 [subsurface metagenome]